MRPGGSILPVEESSSPSAIITASAGAERIWPESIPLGARPAADKLRIAAVASSMRHANLGGSGSVEEFGRGSPSVGSLIQRYTSPAGPKDRAKPVAGGNQESAFRRCRCSFYRSAEEAGGGKWFGSTGRMFTSKPLRLVGRPSPRISSAGPFTLTSPSRNIDCRFIMAQTGNLSAWDGLRRDRANLAIAVLAPIMPVSWGHIAELSRLAGASGAEWHFSKDDHEAPNMKLPIRPPSARMAAISKRNPADAPRYGCFSRTMMFGDNGAGRRYNVFRAL